MPYVSEPKIRFEEAHRMCMVRRQDDDGEDGGIEVGAGSGICKLGGGAGNG